MAYKPVKSVFDISLLFLFHFFIFRWFFINFHFSFNYTEFQMLNKRLGEIENLDEHES